MIEGVGDSGGSRGGNADMGVGVCAVVIRGGST